MTRTYTFVFQPEPEGGYTVTCPALPGLVTYGETLDEARDMARDAMDGLIEVMLEMGEPLPESDAPEAVPRFNRLAHILQDEGEAEPARAPEHPPPRKRGRGTAEGGGGGL